MREGIFSLKTGRDVTRRKATPRGNEKPRSKTNAIAARIAESEAGEARAALIEYLQKLLKGYREHYGVGKDVEIFQRIKVNPSVRKLIKLFYETHSPRRGLYFLQGVFVNIYSSLGIPYKTSPSVQGLVYEDVLKLCVDNLYTSQSCMPAPLQRKVCREGWREKLTVDVPFTKCLVSRYGTRHRSRYELLLVNYLNACGLKLGTDFKLEAKYPKKCHDGAKPFICDITFSSNGKNFFGEIFMFNERGLKEYIRQQVPQGMMKTVVRYLARRREKEQFLKNSRSTILLPIEVTDDRGKAFPHEVFLNTASQKLVDAGLLDDSATLTIDGRLCASLVKNAVSLDTMIKGALKKLAEMEFGSEKGRIREEGWINFAENLNDGKKVREAARLAGLDPSWFIGLCRMKSHKTACRGGWQIKSQMWDKNYNKWDLQSRDELSLLITLPQVLEDLKKLHFRMSEVCAKLPNWVTEALHAETRIPKSTGIYGLRINHKSKYIYLDGQRRGALYEYCDLLEMSPNLYNNDEKVICNYLTRFINASGGVILTNMQLQGAKELLYKSRSLRDRSILYYVLYPTKNCIDQISKRIQLEIAEIKNAKCCNLS